MNFYENIVIHRIPYFEWLIVSGSKKSRSIACGMERDIPRFESAEVIRARALRLFQFREKETGIRNGNSEEQE